jgi:hypothetical protein
MSMERRESPRRPVAWRVRVWLAEALFYLDGRAVDASKGGLGIEMPLPEEQTIIRSGGEYQVDVTRDDETARRDTMTARHVEGKKIGLRFEKQPPG